MLVSLNDGLKPCLRQQSANALQVCKSWPNFGQSSAYKTNDDYLFAQP